MGRKTCFHIWMFLGQGRLGGTTSEGLTTQRYAFPGIRPSGGRGLFLAAGCFLGGLAG
jgi:hypothetical protein